MSNLHWALLHFAVGASCLFAGFLPPMTVQSYICFVFAALNFIFMISFLMIYFLRKE